MFDDFVRLPLTIFITRSTNKVWKYKKEYKTIDLYTFHPKKDALPILQECPCSVHLLWDRIWSGNEKKSTINSLTFIVVIITFTFIKLCFANLKLHLFHVTQIFQWMTNDWEYEQIICMSRLPKIIFGDTRYFRLPVAHLF